MKNLVIIGNGFDLAHGLKTSYKDFIDDLTTNVKKYGIQNIELGDNKLLKVLHESKKELWSDVEHTYYEILKNFDNKKYLQNTIGDVWEYEDIKDLNQEFEKIKNWLCQYLEWEEAKFEPNKNYQLFFEALSRKDPVILNFNYTNTVKVYNDVTDRNIEIIHIHGELNKPENPIIFGFAASNEESKELLIQNDNNYVRNIKKFNYLYTNNEDKLKEHLKSTEYNLFVLGHSCGVSDKLILSQILNSKGIVKIYPFYFKDRKGYFETMVNIDRIIDDYSKTEMKNISFNKLVSFPNAYPMPQNQYDSNLNGYINKILTMKLPQQLKNEKNALLANTIY